MSDVLEKLPPAKEGSHAEFLMNRKKLKVVEKAKGSLAALRSALNERDSSKSKERRKRRAKDNVDLKQKEDDLADSIKNLLTAAGDSLEVLYKDREATASLAALVSKLNLTEAMKDGGDITPFVILDSYNSKVH